MGDRRLTDDERAAIGRDAGVPWQRVCPACGHQPAAVGVADRGTTVGEHGELVEDDPWLGCPACGEEWQAPRVGHVVGEVPPPGSPRRGAVAAAFVEALRRQSDR